MNIFGKRRLLVALLLLSCLLLGGCQSGTVPAADKPVSAAVTAVPIPEPTAAPTAEPTAVPLPAFEPLDWSIVSDAPGSDFTYEIVKDNDPLTSSIVDVVRLTGYTGTASIVKMPDMIDGMYVRQAAKELFKGNTTITHVALPTYLRLLARGVEPDWMFYGCTSLLQVRMPVECATIPGRMFSDCTALREVTFTAEANQFIADSIKTGAFLNCSSLTAITLPKTVTKICSRAFEGCTNLETVIASNVHIIEDEAFLDCSALKTLEISAVDPYVDARAFYGCSSLTDITLTSGETTARNTLVRDGAGYYNVYTNDDGTTASALIYVPSAYTGEITLRADLETISSAAFADSPISHIEIPASVHTIDNSAFRNCKNLETVTVAAGSQLRRLWTSAFAYCSSLKRIDLSNAPMEIDITGDFDDLPALEQIIYPGQDPSATPMPKLTDDQVAAAIDAAVAPYRAQMEAAGYSLTLRWSGDPLSSVELNTPTRVFDELDTQLLTDVIRAIVRTPEAGFFGEFADQVCAFDFSQQGTIEYFTNVMRFQYGYMTYLVTLNHVD